MNAIYLASGSPRRREILENLGFTVHRLPADIDETPKEGEAALEYVRRMACEKNQAAVAQWFAAHDQEPEFAVLTADTTVADGAVILGKPESEADAVDMLERLSGRTHQVLTAVCVYWQGVRHDVVQTSEVRFKTLSGVFVEHLQGSFTGVMGLPVYETAQLLKSLGLEAPPFA